MRFDKLSADAGLFYSSHEIVHNSGADKRCQSSVIYTAAIKDTGTGLLPCRSLLKKTDRHTFKKMAANPTFGGLLALPREV